VKDNIRRYIHARTCTCSRLAIAIDLDPATFTPNLLRTAPYDPFHDDARSCVPIDGLGPPLIYDIVTILDERTEVEMYYQKKAHHHTFHSIRQRVSFRDSPWIGGEGRREGGKDPKRWTKMKKRRRTGFDDARRVGWAAWGRHLAGSPLTVLALASVCRGARVGSVCARVSTTGSSLLTECSLDERRRSDGVCRGI